MLKKWNDLKLNNDRPATLRSLMGIYIDNIILKIGRTTCSLLATRLHPVYISNRVFEWDYNGKLVNLLFHDIFTITTNLTSKLSAWLGQSGKIIKMMHAVSEILALEILKVIFDVSHTIPPPHTTPPPGVSNIFLAYIERILYNWL